MKNILIIISCLFSFTTWSQGIEIFTGINDNHFYDREDKGGHHTSIYKSSGGYSIGIAINDVKVDRSSMRFSLRCDKYGGTIDVGDGGLGGRSTTKAQIEKSLLSVGVYPINLTLIEKLHFNFGIEVSRLISESYQGTISGSLVGQADWNDDLGEKYSQFNATSSVGLVGLISYDIQLNESYALTPQYLFYYGVISEFKESPKETKSLRNFIGLGIKHKMN